MQRGEKEVVKALQAAGHEPAVRRFDHRTATAESAAMAIGVAAERIVKSMVFSHQGEPVVALLPGNLKADMKAVAAALGCEEGEDG